MFCFQMDSNCLICFGSHDSNDCPEKKNEHCTDCFVLIKHCSDHSTICGKKSWLYNPYENLYVQPTKERCILGFNGSLRFLKDGYWRKGTDGLELFSPLHEALFEFKFEKDLSLHLTRFAPIRIIAVVKENGEHTDIFREKLMLLTSRKKLIVAKNLDEQFVRNMVHDKHDWNTTLILVVTAAEGPVISLNVSPPGKLARYYQIPYDEAMKKFSIPSGLDVVSCSTEPKCDEFKNDKVYTPQICQQSNFVEQNLQLTLVTENSARVSVTSRDILVDCPTCFGLHHSNECGQKKFEECYECHVTDDSSHRRPRTNLRIEKFIFACLSRSLREDSSNSLRDFIQITVFLFT